MADNGMNGTMKLLGWVGGIVGLLITIYCTFHVPLVSAINDEVKTRQSEDIRIQRELSQCIATNKDTLAEIKIMLAEQRADIKYIKREAMTSQ